MKFVFVSVLLICTLASVLGDCEIEGKKVKEGEKYAPPGTCLNYTCGKNGLPSAVTCPSFPDSPKCKRIPGDKSKPFPDCCEHPECS